MSGNAIQKNLTGQEYAAELLDRKEYREKLEKRLDAGDVSPQLEVHLHKLRFGNPVNAVPQERVNPYATLSDEELGARLSYLQQQFVALLGSGHLQITVGKTPEPEPKFVGSSSTVPNPDE